MQLVGAKRARGERRGDRERLDGRARLEAIGDRAVADRVGGRAAPPRVVRIERRVVRDREDLAGLRIHHDDAARARFERAHRERELALRDVLDRLVDRQVDVVALRRAVVEQLLREHDATAPIDHRRHRLGRAAEALLASRARGPRCRLRRRSRSRARAPRDRGSDRSDAPRCVSEMPGRSSSRTRRRLRRRHPPLRSTRSGGRSRGARDALDVDAEHDAREGARGARRVEPCARSSARVGEHAVDVDADRELGAVAVVDGAALRREADRRAATAPRPRARSSSALRDLQLDRRDVTTAHAPEEDERARIAMRTFTQRRRAAIEVRSSHPPRGAPRRRASLRRARSATGRARPCPSVPRATASTRSGSRSVAASIDEEPPLLDQPPLLAPGGSDVVAEAHGLEAQREVRDERRRASRATAAVQSSEEARRFTAASSRARGARHARGASRCASAGSRAPPLRAAIDGLLRERRETLVRRGTRASRRGPRASGTR